jgi:hypothetical protein
VTGLLRAGGNLVGAHWRHGVLEVRRETLRWTDATDPSRNLFVPLASIATHALVCRTGPRGEICDGWSFRTSDGETERFRDPDGASGECARAVEAFRAVLEVAPEIAVGGGPSGRGK